MLEFLWFYNLHTVWSNYSPLFQDLYYIVLISYTLHTVYVVCCMQV